MVAATPVSSDVIERFRCLESALIYDVLDSMGLPHQQLSLEIQPLDVAMVLAGPAFTSKSAVSEAAGRVANSSYQISRPDSYAMLDALYHGCILVEDVGNDPVSGG